MKDYSTIFQLHLEGLRPKHVPSSSGMRAFASEAGNCDRQLFYRLQRYGTLDPDSEPDDVTSTIAFHIGNNIHDQWQAMMGRLYPGNFTGEVKWQYPLAPATAIVSGRCDGLYTDESGNKIALEIKTISSWGYKKAVSKNSPKPEHVLQAALSQYALAADMIQVVYICKEWVDPGIPCITIWTYPVGNDVSIRELNRMARIVRTVQAKDPVPPRMARGIPITNILKDDNCRYCSFSEFCEVDGP